MTINTNSKIRHIIQIKNGIMKPVNKSVIIDDMCKKHFNWNSSTFIFENGKY